MSFYFRLWADFQIPLGKRSARVTATLRPATAAPRPPRIRRTPATRTPRPRRTSPARRSRTRKPGIDKTEYSPVLILVNFLYKQVLSLFFASINCNCIIVSLYFLPSLKSFIGLSHKFIARVSSKCAQIFGLSLFEWTCFQEGQGLCSGLPKTTACSSFWITSNCAPLPFGPLENVNAPISYPYHLSLTWRKDWSSSTAALTGWALNLLLRSAALEFELLPREPGLFLPLSSEPWPKPGRSWPTLKLATTLPLPKPRDELWSPTAESSSWGSSWARPLRPPRLQESKTKLCRPRSQLLTLSWRTR